MDDSFFGIKLALLLFLSLILPDLFGRCLIISKQLKTERKNLASSKIVASHLIGLLQDLFVTSELLLIIELIQSLHPKALWMSAMLISFLKLDVLLDGYIYKSTELRLEVPFLAFVRDVKCFWDSAKAKKVAWFYPLGLLFFFMMIYVYKTLSSSVVIEHDFPSLLLFFLASSIALLLFAFTGSRKLSYSSDNILFFQQFWWIKKLYSLVLKKQGIEKIKALKAKGIFKTSCEKYTSISSSFPLLKFTHGFEGEKAFDIQVNPGEKPHVIFLFMESLRSKDVRSLGGKFDVTPNLDRLSQEGILFQNFYANSVKTSRAVTSSLFGIPSDVNASEMSARLDMPFISLAQILSKYGYYNAYLHNGMLEFENKLEFFPKYGFQTLIGRNDILKRFPDAPLTSWGVHDEYLFHFTVEWMLEQLKRKDPLFLTMFTVSTHHPWIVPSYFEPIDLPKSLDERYRHYLQTMQYSDASLGLFIELLKVSGLSKNTILFILGDHGHPMGEHHDNYIEQRYLYEENLKVPLLIYADGRIKTPKVIQEVSSQLDLLPTVMDMLNLKGFNHSKGETLLRKSSDRQVFFHNPYVYQFYGTRKNSYKLIYMRSTKEVELYDLALDPEEQNNIAKEFPYVVEKHLEEVKNYHEFYKSLYENRLFSPFEKKKSSKLIVDLSKNTKHTPGELLQELRKHPFVMHLDLSSCDLLDDQIFAEMISKHKELRSLNIAHCKHLTKNALGSIVLYSPELEWIDITGTEFTDEELKSFEKEMIYLEKLIQKDKTAAFF